MLSRWMKPTISTNVYHSPIVAVFAKGNNIKQKQTITKLMKALLNNISTLKKNLSCMALHVHVHAISIFDKV